MFADLESDGRADYAGKIRHDLLPRREQDSRIERGPRSTPEVASGHGVLYHRWHVLYPRKTHALHQPRAGPPLCGIGTGLVRVEGSKVVYSL